MAIDICNNLANINTINFKGNASKTESPQKDCAQNPINSLPNTNNDADVNFNPKSDFLTEVDLKRYQKAQKVWAKEFAKRQGIPEENVLARLPEIKLGDASQMLCAGDIAGFNNASNTIFVNPIREIANSAGNDEVNIPHESLHGYLYNLQRNYAKTASEDDLAMYLRDSILTKMYYGEHSMVYAGSKLDPQTGQYVYDTMQAPLLSKSERQALVDTIEHFETHYVADEKLTDSGKEFVKAELQPKFTDYLKQFEGKKEVPGKDNMQEIYKYIDSFFARQSLLWTNFRNPFMKDCQKSLDLPLSAKEKELAENSIDGKLSTLEGNIIVKRNGCDNMDSPRKSYFTAYEEGFARREENVYRRIAANGKIKAIKAKGLTPSESLLKELETSEANIKLIDNSNTLHEIEGAIISAPKDSEKAADFMKLRTKIFDTLSHPDLSMVLEKVENLAPKLKNLTREDKRALVESELNGEQLQLLDDYIDVVGDKLSKYDEMDKPVNFLADIPENKTLKEQYNEVLGKIKKFAAKSDFKYMPQDYFPTIEDFQKASTDTSELIQKWVKRLHI